jgi:hypothetical protein
LILSTIVKLAPNITVFKATRRRYPNVIDQRGVCLDALVALAFQKHQRVLTLELDISELRRDVARLSRAIQTVHSAKRLIFRHARASDEPLLIVADAVGWAYARGGDWQRRISPLRVQTIEV